MTPRPVGVVGLGVMGSAMSSRDEAGAVGALQRRLRDAQPGLDARELQRLLEAHLRQYQQSAQHLLQGVQVLPHAGPQVLGEICVSREARKGDGDVPDDDPLAELLQIDAGGHLPHPVAQGARGRAPRRRGRCHRRWPHLLGTPARRDRQVEVVPMIARAGGNLS